MKILIQSGISNPDGYSNNRSNPIPNHSLFSIIVMVIIDSIFELKLDKVQNLCLMSIKTTYPKYNNNWDGQNFYKQETFVPPRTPPTLPLQKTVVWLPTSEKSSASESHARSGKCWQDCIGLLCGLLCVASIIFLVLIPNYPNTFPIGFIAIPASCLFFFVIIALIKIFRCNLEEKCCCCTHRGFTQV